MASSIDDASSKANALDVRFQINLGPGAAVSLSGKFTNDLLLAQEAIEESRGDPLEFIAAINGDMELFDRLLWAGLIKGPMASVIQNALDKDPGAMHLVQQPQYTILVTHLGHAYLKAAELYRAMYR